MKRLYLFIIIIFLLASANISAQETLKDTKPLKAWKEIFRIKRGFGRSTMASNLGVIITEPLENKMLGVFFACSTKINLEDIRVGFLDKDGKRHEAIPACKGETDKGNGAIAFLFVTPESCPRTNIRNIVLEQFMNVTEEEFKEFQKTEEERLAEYVRDSPLPRPVVNKPYLFKLIDVNGKEVSTDAWRGKVILIDFWATW